MSFPLFIRCCNCASCQSGWTSPRGNQISTIFPTGGHQEALPWVYQAVPLGFTAWVPTGPLDQPFFTLNTNTHLIQHAPYTLPGQATHSYTHHEPLHDPGSTQTNTISQEWRPNGRCRKDQLAFSVMWAFWLRQETRGYPITTVP